MSTEVATYDEFSAEQRHAAIDNDLLSIRDDQKVIDENDRRIESLLVAAINALTRQGQALTRIRGREQITFAFVKGYADRLPESWGEDDKTIFETAKKRVALTCKIPGPIKALEDLLPEARREVLQQMDLLPVLARGMIGDGEAMVPRTAITFFFNGIGRLKAEWKKCLREKKLEERTPEQLRTFLEETEWVQEERGRARQLIEDKLRGGNEE